MWLVLALSCRNKDYSLMDSGLIAEDTAVDTDGDGFVDADDCAPEDPAVNPDADEVCNGLDDDCDGTVDNDASDAQTWYTDADADGWGGDVSVEACDQPSGTSDVDGDCDDSDAAFHPGADEDDCTDPADYNCDGSTGYADEDADGFPACEECDDSDAAVNPDATEICNGIDDDCDAAIDDEDPDLDLDSATRWYRDSDEDAYGDATTSALSCEQPEGWVEDWSDCDDNDAEVNPGADEICNGTDDDCDGLTDDEDDSVDLSTASTWYADSDGDGYGEAATSSVACSQPSGAVAGNTDCDDSDADVNPGADEYCNSIDDDCDGDIDEDDAIDATTWYADADGDEYGDSSTSTTSCTQPSGYVTDDTDCNDGDDSVNPDETEVCDSVDNDCDRLVDDDDSDLDTSTGSTWYDDADGDGYGDASASSESCDAASGQVSDGTDCDDTDSGVNPGATESCDATDEDCDSTVDEGGSCPCNLEHDSGVAYLFCETTATWSDAQADCATYGYHLASIGSATENTFLDTTADGYSTSKWWFGFTDAATEGTWVWESGETASYTNWHSGEPNDWSTGEDCAQLNRWSDDTWNDEACAQAFRYICEAP